jgi:hypothetical protein
MNGMELDELLNPTYLVPVAVALVLCIGVVVGVVKLRKSQNTVKNIELWMHGAYSIWTGGEDSGTWAAARAQKSLGEWYGVTGAGSLWKTIAELSHGQTGNPAWDQVRALDILRIGVAATYIDADSCRTEARKIGVMLQARYRSWDDLAQAFEAGMHAWQNRRGTTDPNERGRVQRNLPVLRQAIWPRIKYDTLLVPAD